MYYVNDYNKEIIANAIAIQILLVCDSSSNAIHLIQPLDVSNLKSFQNLFEVNNVTFLYVGELMHIVSEERCGCNHFLVAGNSWKERANIVSGF